MEHLLEFTDIDWQRARRLQDQERVDPLIREEMFPRVVYCVLSATEYFEKQMQVVKRIEARGLMDPQEMLARPDELSDAVSIARYGNHKTKRLLSLADWWQKTDWPERLKHDAENGMDLEFKLRDELAKARVGMGWKCASLFMRMCDYENIVPVDLWASRMLKEFGYEIVVPSTKDKGRTRKGQGDLFTFNGIELPNVTRMHNPTGGISGGTYLSYEQQFAEIAEKHGIKPAIFQMLIYAKFSTLILPTHEQSKLNMID